MKSESEAAVRLTLMYCSLLNVKEFFKTYFRKEVILLTELIKKNKA